MSEELHPIVAQTFKDLKDLEKELDDIELLPEREDRRIRRLRLGARLDQINARVGDFVPVPDGKEGTAADE